MPQCSEPAPRAHRRAADDTRAYPQAPSHRPAAPDSVTPVTSAMTSQQWPGTAPVI
ncbi:hypothetical protein LC55x_1959 [Lysobacter capsici]|nr:hypothetical protein LC55x_1959 [Lysobacter capsici]